MLNWLKKSQVVDLGQLVQARDTAGLAAAVAAYGQDVLKRTEAITALGEALCYWSGCRFGAADKSGIRVLVDHLKNDENQGVRLAAGRALSQFRGLSLLGDDITVEVDAMTLSSFQTAELNDFQAAAGQGDWQRALELIDKIFMLPEETRQPDDLVQKYCYSSGAWPFENQPTSVAARWLSGYLQNLQEGDRDLARRLWIARGETMFNVFAEMQGGRSNTSVGFRMDSAPGLVYAGTTRKVLWDNADALGISACLIYLLAQGEKSQYNAALEFINRADSLNAHHSHADRCHQVAEQIAELKNKFNWLQ